MCLFGLFLVLGMGSAWASIVGVTDPTLFNDFVLWGQLGASSTILPTPQTWVSNLGVTGSVGAAGTGEQIQVLTEGTEWSGNFANGMKLVYNGVVTVPQNGTDLAATFDSPLYGAGAYIQTDFYGAFTATVTVFDMGFLPLGTFTIGGTSDGNVGTALFIGMLDTVQEIGAIQFNAVDQFGDEDFAIGTMNLSSLPQAPPGVPEPTTFVLLSLGLGAFGLWRRKK
jgi:hypothetical protein